MHVSHTPMFNITFLKAMQHYVVTVVRIAVLCFNWR